MDAQNVLIRNEKDTDYKVISDVTESARIASLKILL